MRDFFRALVCEPADTVDQGLRMKDMGTVDIIRAKEQHRREYCLALEELGFSLISLPVNNRYPDSVFVEDPAVIIGNLLVILRLRCPERQGEETRLEKALAPYFSNVVHLESSGFVEGGDVLILEKEIYIGISGRTDASGAEDLAKIAKDQAGFKTHAFQIPAHYLHLKGGVSYQRGCGTIVVSDEIAPQFSFASYRQIVVSGEERFGANCISRGRKIVMHAGKPKVKKILDKAGFDVTEVDVSEFEKIDGALTCMSKIF